MNALANAVGKSHMQFRYPENNPGDDPRLRGEPDRSLLNRNSWYEVLYFINKFAKEHGRNDSGVALKAERLIQRHLPSNIRSHENVRTWLLNNWKTFEN